MAELAVSVDVAVDAQQLWDLVVDWPRQGEWVFLTTVRGDGNALGGRLEAVTGRGRLRFVDPMEIVTWDPPRRCVVRHHGKVVRGSAAFEVEDRGPGQSRFTWVEWLELPLGIVGQLGWLVVRPLVAATIRLSLRRLARLATVTDR
ncbi:MAG: SRPBCC family protein [Frankia sp.]|nr:SRPBCC family protein [Frankia sp.]